MREIADIALNNQKLNHSIGETLRELISGTRLDERALELGDIAAFSVADERFHSTIARLSGNETVIKSLERWRAQVQLIRLTANQDPDLVERTARERPLILATLRERDGARAAQEPATILMWFDTTCGGESAECNIADVVDPFNERSDTVQVEATMQANGWQATRTALAGGGGVQPGEA